MRSNKRMFAVGRFVAYRGTPPTVVAPDPYDAFCLMWQYIGRVHRERVEFEQRMAGAGTPRYFLTLEQARDVDAFRRMYGELCANGGVLP